jgi:cytochrome c
MKNFVSAVGAVLVAGIVGLAGVAHADGDPAKGQKVFIKCKTCHDLEAGKNKVGPSLAKLFGRKAGTAAGYSYSKPMIDSGITWDEKSLKAYVKDPKAVVPGGKMAFAGIKDDEEREDLIAYLKQATK